MPFQCLLIDQENNKREEIKYTQEQLSKLVDDGVINRAISFGQTSTTIIIKNRTYKMLINYLSN